VEPVDVLVLGDRILHHRLWNVFVAVERHLDNDAVDLVVVVELADLVEELSLGGGAWQVDVVDRDANLCTCFDLHPDVDCRVLPAADLHNGQLWRKARVFDFQRIAVFFQLATEGARYFFAADYCSRHGLAPT